ncbi:related to copper transport protein [Moesziomyces antarcticus]|uniref:Copper transport protein n=2 Tax=Pseudozyma antarctica TaxID=84753 RepID=A0A5C3FTC5_PSEA2|nr:related to copper transport protein [Moesziomyces antarcticus]
MNHSGMGGMDGGMGGASCKISMLWNWYTIDACFLSSSWHVTTKATFAVSCIGVVLMVVCLEALRRAGVEFDKALSRQLLQRKLVLESDLPPEATTRQVVIRVTPLQQLARAVLHAVTFGLAYIIMLLAMYFNGYIILSIILGAGIGKFVCDWKLATFTLNADTCDRASRTSSAQCPSTQTKLNALLQQDADAPGARSHTVCCE